jgi:hypothetical protein
MIASQNNKVGVFAFSQISSHSEFIEPDKELTDTNFEPRQFEQKISPKISLK